MSKGKKPPEAVSGSYTPIPHAVLDSKAFQSASKRAKALLFELLRQHNGGNNGHLHLAVGWLRKRGWTSNDQIQKAKIELLKLELICKTRQGGLVTGHDCYALTWLDITNYANLDIRKAGYYRGSWHNLDQLSLPKKRECHTGVRNSTVPPSGTGTVPVVPPYGALNDVSADLPVPSDGNNECCQLTASKKRTRVVGKKGASGTYLIGRAM